MKKWLKIIILFFIFFISNFSLSNADIAENTVIKHHINFDIKNSGDANVVEEIEGIFCSGTELYRSYEEMLLEDITNFSVKENGVGYEKEENWEIANSREQKKNKYCICKNVDGVELVWGIGKPGYHKYILRYTLERCFYNNELKIKVSSFDKFNKMQVVCKGSFDTKAFATLKNGLGSASVKNKEVDYNVEKVDSNYIIIYLNYEGIDNSSDKENVIKIELNNKIDGIFIKVIIALMILILIIIFILIKFKKRKNNYAFIPF